MEKGGDGGRREEGDEREREEGEVERMTWDRGKCG